MEGNDLGTTKILDNQTCQCKSKDGRDMRNSSVYLSLLIE